MKECKCAISDAEIVRTFNAGPETGKYWFYAEMCKQEAAHE
jgi:hypothetical protein